MEYTFFDGLIDSVFVIGRDREIVYCNEAAAKLCESSVRRLVRGKAIFDVIEFSNKNLFVMGGTTGETEPAPYQEIEFNLKNDEKSGKVQLAIEPFSEPSGESRWVIIVRDVTIEEVLHAKYHKQLEEKEVYIGQLQVAQKKLEEYSKNLEQMVEERTGEVKRANVMLNAIMNSLGQGFFAFDESGDCADFYTRACVEILEAEPARKKVWDVLKLDEKEASTFKLWMKSIFSEALPFDSLRELGPSLFHHSAGRHIELEYFPIRDTASSGHDDGGAIRNVVVVATDRTSEFLANQALEREKKFARMVVKLVTARRPFSQFLVSARQTIDDVYERSARALKRQAASYDSDERAWLYRELHTLEGESAIYSIQELWAGARKCQEVLSASSTILEFNRSVDALKKQYEEFLSVNHNLFSSLGVFEGGSRVELSQDDINDLLAQLKKAGTSPQIFELVVEKLEKETISRLLEHYSDSVEVLAKKLNKSVAPLKITGGDQRIFAEPYKNLFSSFIHVFRNCLDHGIESSEDRIAAGKSPEGHIEIRVEPFQEKLGGTKKNWLRIQIIDDGRGIPADVIPRVFQAGFSTRTEVGEYSGRGVGMNVIAVEAEALGGRARISSQIDKGTSTIIEIPELQQVARQSTAA